MQRTVKVGVVVLSVVVAGFVVGGGVSRARDGRQPCGSLPVRQIEEILEAEGMVEHGVLDVEIAREDIPAVRGPASGPPVTFTPAFELHGDAYFQPLDGGQAFLNGDIALKESEVNPFVAALIRNGLVWQAYHQHLPMEPQIWFVHYRGKGDAVALARALKAALDVTSIPFPQTRPQSPTTPLDAEKLARILHGSASVGDEGVVTVTVERRDTVEIDGVRVNPAAGISTTIEFKPLGGEQAAVVPDFSMTADEIQPVVRKMLLQNGWFQGCLYNQETDERPQLYFDHMLKTGNAYELAREIRRGLDKTRSE